MTKETTTLEFTSTVIVDVEQALEVLRVAGPEAFSIFFLLETEAFKDEVTIEKLAETANMDRAVVEKACYKLGLVNLGIRE